MSHIRSEQEKQRRRNIIKGAAGVPLIFTLPNGAALAATSLTCKNKSQLAATNENPKGGVVSAGTNPDKWVRFKTPAYGFKINGTNLTGFKLTVSGIDKWYSVALSGAVALVTPPTNGANAPTLISGSFCYLMVDYDKYYNGTSLGPQDFIYLGSALVAPIAGSSCWNSLSGTTNSTGNLIS